MIVLDTNVVSEAMRPRPDARVIDWLDAHTSLVMISSVTVAEILFGIRLLPEGRRRADLQTAFELFTSQGVRNRVLEFDHAAAESYSWIAAGRQRSGRRMEAFDAMIAAIARSRGADVATRDVADFADCGLRIINPWE